MTSSPAFRNKGGVRAWPTPAGVPVSNRSPARKVMPNDNSSIKIGNGNLLLSANSQLDSPLAWAALSWLSILDIVLFLAVAALEWLATPWARAAAH